MVCGSSTARSRVNGCALHRNSASIMVLLPSALRKLGPRGRVDSQTVPDPRHLHVGGSQSRIVTQGGGERFEGFGAPASRHQLLGDTINVVPAALFLPLEYFTPTVFDPIEPDRPGL